MAALLFVSVGEEAEQDEGRGQRSVQERRLRAGLRPLLAGSAAGPTQQDHQCQTILQPRQRRQQSEEQPLS